MDQSVQLVDAWATDIIRVGARFGDQLLACPSSIHSLVPPLCPPDSVVSRTYHTDVQSLSSSPQLIVKGCRQESWDDCLVRINFSPDNTTAVCHGDRFLAIGFETGKIALYHHASIQLMGLMKHPERIKLLAFSSGDQLLASCSNDTLCVWKPKPGTMVDSFRLPSSPLAVTFLGVDILLCALKSGALTHW